MLSLFVPGSNWEFQALIFLTIPDIQVPPPSLSLPNPHLQGSDFHMCPGEKWWKIGPGGQVLAWIGQEGKEASVELVGRKR